MFFTASGNCIKTWSALTGQLLKCFNEASSSDISWLELDCRQTRLLLGEQSGRCLVVNAVNVAPIKSLRSHQGEVIFFKQAVLEGSNFLITAGTDNQIHISWDDKVKTSELFRVIELNRETSMTRLELMPHSKYLMVGTTIGMLGIYEIDTGRLSDYTP